MVSEFLVNAQ